MSDHGSKNGDTPDPLEELSKLGQALLGEGRKMFGSIFGAMKTPSSTSSSSPTSPVSESPPPSSNGSIPMPSVTDAPVVSSSTSTSTEYDLSEPLRLAPDPRKAEVKRPCTLILHYDQFGTEEQIIKNARSVLRYLEVRGIGIYAARLNDQYDIEPADSP